MLSRSRAAIGEKLQQDVLIGCIHSIDIIEKDSATLVPWTIVPASSKVEFQGLGRQTWAIAFHKRPEAILGMTMHLQSYDFFASSTFSDQEYGNISRSDVGDDAFQCTHCRANAAHKRKCLCRNNGSYKRCVLVHVRGHTTS